MTGTLALRQWAAICAPMTPAPSTATFFTMTLFTAVSPRVASLFAHDRIGESGGVHVERAARCDELR